MTLVVVAADVVVADTGCAPLPIADSVVLFACSAPGRLPETARCTESTISQTYVLS